MSAAPVPLVPASIGRVMWDPVRALWLWGLVVVALVAGVPALTPARTALALALTGLTLCLGHSVGLHRGIIHRSYETSRAVRGTFAWLFVLSGLGGPLSWARLHAVRDYWQSRADCPRFFAYDHSLARDFVWNLHRRFVAADARAEARLPADVLTDPWLRFLERTWPLHVLALAAVLLVVDGPGAVAVCVCARSAAGILGHWFIGYAAHAWGERRHALPGARETGTNVWVLGLISFGEGFHNNHHAFPRSARMGHRWHELDLGWLALRGLRRVGLVHSVRTAGDAGRGSGAPAPASLRISVGVDDSVRRIRMHARRPDVVAARAEFDERRTRGRFAAHARQPERSTPRGPMPSRDSLWRAQEGLFLPSAASLGAGNG